MYASLGFQQISSIPTFTTMSSSSTCRTPFLAEKLSSTLQKVDELRRLRNQTIALAGSGYFRDDAVQQSVDDIDRKLVQVLRKVDGLRCCYAHK